MRQYWDLSVQMRLEKQWDGIEHDKMVRMYKMGTVKATLVGVSIYDDSRIANLPACKNDIVEVKNALVKGLCVPQRNIRMVGSSGRVDTNEFVGELQIASSMVESDDTYIFYFSGHGNNGILAFSEKAICVQEVIGLVDSIKAKNKIIILDSCRSGDFVVPKAETPANNELVEKFAGAGYAVMASCSASENSTFYPPENKVSLYTHFLCDALTAEFTIKKGKKSLEEINDLIMRMVDIWNQKGERIQHPIFRANITGTIFFQVQKYEPYQKLNIYEETEEYIIYEIVPFHHSMQKRYTAKVILKYHFEESDIVRITKKIVKEIKYSDVYQNSQQEQRLKRLPANMIRCHMGYDEQDMEKSNFKWITIWVDDTLDKNNWYKGSDNSKIIDGILLDKPISYNALRIINQETVTAEEYIKASRECLNEIVGYANQFITEYREYSNGIISEDKLIENVKELNKQISVTYFKITDLPSAPLKCNSWLKAIQQIAGTIHDFTLFYDQGTMNTWSQENRNCLMKITLERYQQEIEVISEEDKKLLENN